MTTELAPIEQQAIGDALSAASIKAQVQLIHDVMREAMIKDVHYGVIPGTTKPTLLKPGAQKLMLTFRFDPQFETAERFLGDHLFVKSKCVLYHITSGRRLGSGEASCSTKETKYAYRKGQRLCPQCGTANIIKGLEKYGGGWLCWKKNGGCGAKWPDGAKVIEDQKTERVPNEDLADQYNTVLKMANKRSLIDAVLNVTGASDVFTQDIGDAEEEENNPPIDAAAPRGGKTSQEAGLANETVKSGGQAKGSVMEPPAAPLTLKDKLKAQVEQTDTPPPVSETTEPPTFAVDSRPMPLHEEEPLPPISSVILDLKNAPDDSAKIHIYNEASAKDYSQADKRLLMAAMKAKK